MLEEVLADARREGDLARRWYTSVEFDLFVWRESTHVIVQFQLCWKRGARLEDADHIPEETITWHRDSGVRQHQVREADRYKTPVLQAGAGVAMDELVTALRGAEGNSGYPDVRFVLATLEAGSR